MLAIRHSRSLTVRSGLGFARSLKTPSEYRPSFMASQYSNDKPNVVVVGGSYVGLRSVEEISKAMHQTHNIVLVEKNTHFQHLFAFPRFAVVPGFEQKAFIPYTHAFHSCPPNSTSLVSATATQIFPGKVVLDHGEPISYDFLVLATGTKLPPPGTVPTEGKANGIAYFQRHQELVARSSSITIIGGGAVGVQMATDIKDYYPAKSVTLVHSREYLMNKFHPNLHELIMDRAKELGIDVVLNDRVKIPAAGFPIDGTKFDVELTSGKRIPSDFSIICTGQKPMSDPIKPLSPGLIDSAGYVSVRPTFQVASPAFPHVFALGDVAASGAPKAARPGFVQAAVVASNIHKLARGCSDDELDKYYPELAGIHLTLGIKRNVKFRNPATPEGAPTCHMADDGHLDMNCGRIWQMRAPGIIDYYS